MAVSSVKLDPASKKLLEELQARLQLETGTRYRMQDILAASLRVAAKRRGELLAELQGGWKPLSPEEAERLLDEYSFEGPEDASSRIDEVLYG